MTSLKIIASLFIDSQSGGDASKDSRLSYQIIVPRIRHILNDFIKPLVFEKYNDDDRSAVTNFIVTYEMTLTNDTLGSYVDLTDNYISLPNGRGIHRIILRVPNGAMPGQYVDAECIPTHHAAINRNTRAGRYPTHKKYYLEGNRIRFQNIFVEPSVTKKAVIQIICAAPDSVAENDSLPLSPDMVSQVLLKLNAFVFQAPQDKLNNANPVPNV